MTMLISERTHPGRIAYALPPCDVPMHTLPDFAKRAAPAALPELSELDVVRHYTALSRRNFGIDNGMYPLGSCTMKYNPKLHEEIMRIPGLAHVHPEQPVRSIQGMLALLVALEHDLAQITGMDAITLQPAAGAHGEYTGLMLIRAYHEHKHEHRTHVIVPDSSHGTNPASAMLAGYEVITIPSDPNGLVNTEALRRVVGPHTAALMLTNPNTLGLFEKDIVEIADIVHSAGGMLYYDGANSNAILGIARPGDMGFDVVHLNVHKTMSTPHGGGGPGAGPVGVKEALIPFLPNPRIQYTDGQYTLYDNPQSIGKVKAYLGNIGVLIRAFAYIRSYGPQLRNVSEHAVLHANYLKTRLSPFFDVPVEGICKHEFVLSAKTIKQQTGVRALDIAKRLLDYGFHPPTMYFPTNIEECLMIEPTETESLETLDAFADALIRIVEEAHAEPDLVVRAPHTTPVKRLDEATAARKPVLHCHCGVD
ncbi:MAG: aminomethyl-transferring glycine dehydrogenase subunit GcvPB [Paenibacillaceae bacterium]|nr:aminomethyl-transferring glycine dehydrogenase subunit GcvPB [Paenibacillaceae bacterium]